MSIKTTYQFGIYKFNLFLLTLKNYIVTII